MRYLARGGLAASASALVVGLLLAGVASAQEQPSPPSQTSGLVVGMVARCVTGVQQPAVGVAVGIEGGPAALARTDASGQFIIGLPPGEYTVIASAEDGSASRPYVPVEAGAALDIGVLEIGGGIAGCGPDTDVDAPMLPTFTPTPTPDVPTPTPTPQATPTPTPTPSDDPDMAPPSP